MAGERIAQEALTDQQRELAEKLLASIRRDGHEPIVHRVQEASFRGKKYLQLVAVVKQKRDVQRLTLWGCRLGAPPAHEAGSASFGSYDHVRKRLDDDTSWTEQEKRKIVAFIDGDES